MDIGFTDEAVILDLVTRNTRRYQCRHEGIQQQFPICKAEQFHCAVSGSCNYVTCTLATDTPEVQFESFICYCYVRIICGCALYRRQIFECWQMAVDLQIAMCWQNKQILYSNVSVIECVAGSFLHI